MFFLCRRAWKTHETTKEQHNETHVGLSSLFNVSNEETKKHVIITCVLLNNILPPFYSVQILCAEVTKEKTSEE